jgi:hypothetical protein
MQKIQDLFMNFLFLTKKIGVWCAISARRITGPIFYDNTVNAAMYKNNILSPFSAQSTEEERLYGIFQQDSAKVHTAYASLEAPWKVLSDRIISHGLWPLQSPYLTSCGFICE